MSASEAAAAFASTAKTEVRKALGSEALAQGLLLVRASALGVVRLQLAMKRRDRPVALQTVDELMMLDRQISDFVGDLSVAADDVAAGSRALEQQRRALAVDKLALAAGTRGPRITDVSGRWIEQAPPDPVPQQRVADARAETAQDLEFEQNEGHGISARLAVALVFLAAFIAAAAFLFLSETGQALIAAPVVHEGAPR